MFKKVDMSNVKEGSLLQLWLELRRNKRAIFGLVIIVLLILIAVFAEYIAPFTMQEQNLTNALQKPNAVNWFGTDELGRDVFSRIVYGTQVSLMVGVVSVTIALLVGGTMGLFAGFYSGKIDTLVMRIVDILLAIPSILLAISIVAAIGPSLRNVMIAVGIGNIPTYARIIRSSVISLREKQFIEASRALGVSDFKIMLRHILPNVMGPIIVQSSIGIAGAILSAAGLGFIGLGITIPQAEWGTMLSDGRNYIRDFPHLTFFPGLAIMITILAFNLLGDGLRDAIDPKMRDR